MNENNFVLKSNPLKIFLKILWVIISFALFILFTLAIPIVFNGSWTVILGILFYYGLSLLSLYTSIYILLNRPTKLVYNDDSLTFVFIHKTIHLKLKDLKGYSFSIERSKFKSSKIICIYADFEEVIECSSFDLKIEKLSIFLKNSKIPFLGNEPQKFKYLGFIKRDYKYI